MRFWQKVADRFRGRPVDWEELEAMFLQADLGVQTSMQLLAALQAVTGFSATADQVERAARAEILKLLPPPLPPLLPFPDRPRVILVVGVNGSGKTTSLAKLAGWLRRDRHTVMMAAGDTFRAAAIEQLVAWGDKLGIEVVRGQYQGDAAALCHDAYDAAVTRGTQFLLCDTAGRLHTKHNLMAELAKVKRVLGRRDPGSPHETWIVVDATTGTNALVQAREFHAAIGLTGAILTKLDGSGKGGTAVALQQELNLPVRFVGTGEREGDLARFDPRTFAENML